MHLEGEKSRFLPMKVELYWAGPTRVKTNWWATSSRFCFLRRQDLASTWRWILNSPQACILVRTLHLLESDLHYCVYIHSRRWWFQNAVSFECLQQKGKLVTLPSINVLGTGLNAFHIPNKHGCLHLSHN